MESDQPIQPLSVAIGHAICLKCPNCGQGKLYQRYLKTVDVCRHCHTKWVDYPADDGPAWLTILVVGHMMASIAVTMAISTDWPIWQIFILLAVGTLALTLAMLPFAKAAFITVIWKTGAKADRQE